MVLVTQQMQHVFGFRPWMLFWQPTLLAQCVGLDLRLYYAVVQNLVHRCENVPHTTAESSDTPPIHFFPTRVGNPSICSSCFPQAYNATPFKWSNCDIRCKTLGTIYRRMTFGTFMIVCMRECTPALPPEVATLCLNMTV